MSLGIAVLGSGSIAEQHLAAIRNIDGLTLRGVFSRTEARARAAGEREGCRWSTDARALIADPEVRVVDILTSSGSHAELALAALDAGKHLMVEKPLAMTSADARKVVGRAKEKGLTVAVISQRRFEPQNEAARKAVRDGAIGRLLLVEVSCPFYRTQAYYDSADWRGKKATDGGALMNQSIHSVDLMLWMAGPVRSVFGRTATQTHRMESEDLALAVATFESGAFGTVMASTSIQPGFQPSLGLYGEKGTIKLEGSSVLHWTVPGVAKPEGAPPASTGVASPKLADSRCHELQLRDLVEAIRERRAPVVTGEDGARAVAFVEAVYRSGETGAPVVLE